jgi:hypothetical protein
MKLTAALLVALGLPLAAGCGLVLGIEDRAVPTNPDAAASPDGDTPGDAATDGSLADGPAADAPFDAALDASADADADAAVFVPSTLTGLEVWLDGDRDIITSAGEVSEWRDQSGKARGLVRGYAASPSILKEKFPGTTHDAARFVPDAAGPAGYLVTSGFTLQQPLTVAMAVYPTRVTAGFYDLFFGGTAAPTIALGRFNDDFKISSGFNATFSQLLVTNTWTMAPHILVAVYDGATSSLQIDGASISGTLSDSPLEGLVLSSSSAYHGYIGEVLVYSRHLPAPEQAAVRGYLKARYAP